MMMMVSEKVSATAFRLLVTARRISGKSHQANVMEWLLRWGLPGIAFIGLEK